MNPMTLKNRIHQFVSRPVRVGGSALAATFLATAQLSAQTDNFNYTAPPLAAGWTTTISANYPGKLSSPTDRFGGQALRMETTNQVPVPFPLMFGTPLQNTPRIIAWRNDRTYTNFYIAVDLLDWNKSYNTATNATYLGLIAHATNNTASVGYDPGVPVGRPDGLIFILDYNRFGGGYPNGTRGVIDIAYLFDGQPAVNNIGLQGDFALDIGHSYRLVFTGTNLVDEFNVKTNDIYYGRVYDLLDLTRPLATVSCSSIAGNNWADSGYSGIICIGKDVAVSSDVTYDNFEASEYPPTSVSLPGTPYGTNGIPQVVNRTPASWTNFYPAVGGVHFTAATLNANTIATADIRLFLNGVDVSSGLTFGGTASARTVNFSGLASNMVYDARIELANNLGQKTTNLWTFDTFSDAFLASAACKNIECEDFDFNNGSFIDNPVASGFTWTFTYGQHLLAAPVLDASYPWAGALNQGPTAYVNQPAVNAATNGGVGDFSDLETGSPLKSHEADYRPVNVGNSQGVEDFQFASLLGASGYHNVFDTQRSKYSAVDADLQEVFVRRNQNGDWHNYTRTFNGANYYNVYLRAGCDLSSIYKLDRMVGGTTNALGTFVLTNAYARSNFRYTALKDGAGQLAVVNLSGVNKLRLLMDTPPWGYESSTRSSMLNYLAFVPALLVESSATVDTGYAIDNTAVIEPITRTITIPQSGAARFYRLRWDHAVTITSVNVVGGNVVLTY